MPSLSFEERLSQAARAVEHELEQVLPQAGGPEGKLFEAMRYAVLGGGKRVRPFLVTASAALFDVPAAQAERVGAAVECVHTYSLVHDDLPCMDDDDLRRGRPTLHKQFDEATAVLAGDALLTLAFELLSDAKVIPNATVRSELVAALAAAAGGHGMVGGQIMDLAAEHRELDELAVIRLQRMKTGEMIAFSAMAGAILGRAGHSERNHLRMYAQDLGLAFQITDDILDLGGDVQAMGKSTGKDAKAGKATFVALGGLDKARARAAMLAGQAAAHLELFGERANALRGLCDFVLSRQN